MQRLQGRSDAIMMFGVCYHEAKNILDKLETTEFSLGQTKIESCNNPVYNEQVLWLLWMQFPNQDKAVCDGGHECDRSRLH